MQLFSRRVQTAGPPGEVMAYATEMCAHVSAVSGREVGLWATNFGAPLGTMMYSVRVAGVADWQAMSAQIQSDAEYHAKLATGAKYSAGPPEDTLLQPLNGELGDPPPVGSMALLTSAEMANGAYAEAIAWGLDMAQHATTVTGVPTLFLVQQFGSFGSVGWIAVTPDAAAVDAANSALNADAAYMEKLGAAGELFVEGSGHRMLATRIA